MALHVGWAIEGPVGSDFKIDASYLSPTVALCELLESSTKVYGLPLIISESQYKILSLRAKERMRKIDVVKAMDRVLGLYVFNVNFESAVDEMLRQPPHYRQQGNSHAGGKEQIDHGPPREHELGDLVKDEGLYDISSATLEKEGAEFLFVIDRDVTKLQEGIPEELNLEYRDALCQMIEGNWDACQEILVRILRQIWPGDGPTEALYRYMSEYSFKCPPNWNGYHLLDAETLAQASREPVDLDGQEEVYSPGGNPTSPRGTGRVVKPTAPSKKNLTATPPDSDSRASFQGKGNVSFGDGNQFLAMLSDHPDEEKSAVVEAAFQWRKGDWR
jgi:hypothetical protein